ncbi:hypothetical protein K435DRAFT_853299 [Dendrothele bispora CBS 962.96]|uniref:Uncharacterized protein n=1 Tax=Dendrothele bispora (strain CBS 962.96) TaxID=1314807 RepID=A0A4S8MH36_DENBC|nr:hypothetical protein K435DRAFT_853299 [Dendrothele bispora CBS 962.96]
MYILFLNSRKSTSCSEGAHFPNDHRTKMLFSSSTYHSHKMDHSLALLCHDSLRITEAVDQQPSYLEAYIVKSRTPSNLPSSIYDDKHSYHPSKHWLSKHLFILIYILQLATGSTNGWSSQSCRSVQAIKESSLMSKHVPCYTRKEIQIRYGLSSLENTIIIETRSSRVDPL